MRSVATGSNTTSSKSNLPNAIAMRLSILALLLYLATVPLSAQEEAAVPADVYTLRDAVDFALLNSNAVRNARVTILDAEQNVRERLSSGLPQLNGSLDYTHYLKVPVLPLPEAFAMGDPNAPTEIAFQLKNNFIGGLTLSSQLFDASFFVGLRAARASRSYYELQLEEVERQVRNQVTQSYFPVLLLSTNVQIIDRNISNLQRSLREAEAQYAAGFVEQLDVDRLRLSLNNLQASRKDVAQQLENATRSLRFALNYPADRELQVADNLDELELEVEEAALLGDIPYTNRAELRVLDQTLVLQDLNVELQRAAYLPRLTAIASGQYQYQGDNLSDGFWAPTVLLGVSATIPIVDFGGRSSRLERARLAKEQVENQRDDLRRSIALEITNARGTFTTARERLQTTRGNLDLAQRIYDTTQIKYREGVGSSIETVQAEQQLYEAQANYLNALYDTLVAKETLYLALGR